MWAVRLFSDVLLFWLPAVPSPNTSVIGIPIIGKHVASHSATVGLVLDLGPINGVGHVYKTAWKVDDKATSKHFA